MFVSKTISASKAKNNFGFLLDEVCIRRNPVTITKNNRPVAKVTPIYNYASIKTKPSLHLSDKEYEKVKKGTTEFRKTFKFSY